MTAKKPTKAQITHGALHEHQAIELLRERHSEHGTIVLPQVRNGTGHTRQTRTADALVCETWSSRGIGFTGVEYKRSRADWLKELRDPAKAEEIGKFCRYWVMLAPAGLIDVDELPELWGLWEIHNNKTIRLKKKAPLKKYLPPTIEFICSILRANREYDPARVHDWTLETRIRKRIEKEFEGRFERIRKERDDIRTKVRQFEDASGMSLGWNMDRSIQLAPKLLHHLSYPEQVFEQLDKARKMLADTVEEIDKIKGEKA